MGGAVWPVGGPMGGPPCRCSIQTSLGGNTEWNRKLETKMHIVNTVSINVPLAALSWWFGLTFLQLYCLLCLAIALKEGFTILNIWASL